MTISKSQVTRDTPPRRTCFARLRPRVRVTPGVNTRAVVAISRAFDKVMSDMPVRVSRVETKHHRLVSTNEPATMHNCHHAPEVKIDDLVLGRSWPRETAYHTAK